MFSIFLLLGQLEAELNNRRNLVDVDQKKAGAETCSENAHGEESIEQEGPNFSMENDEMDDFYWEDGSVQGLESTEKCLKNSITGLTVEFDISPYSAKRKSTRRASAEDKVVNESSYDSEHCLYLVSKVIVDLSLL